MMSEPVGPTKFAVEEGRPDASKNSNAVASLTAKFSEVPMATTAVVF